MKIVDAYRITRSLQATAAPNDWEAFQNGLRADRGTDLPFDYEIHDHGSITILYPVSNPAREWLAAHLPDDCPRWGREGYAIETNFVAPILEHLARDGLLSEEEFVEACRNEADAQNHWAQHQQDFAE